MDALKAAGLCALLAAPPQGVLPCDPVAHVSSTSIDRWLDLIDGASQRFDIPAVWIAAVMARESAGLTALGGRPIISRAGAMGLMQLMPDTWSDMRARYRLGPDPFDPHDNIFAGAAYLRRMFDRYGYPNLFAAYHAGPGHLDAVLAGAKPLPAATKTYLESIVSGVKLETISSENRLSISSNPASDSLFFVRVDDGNSSVTTSNSPPDGAKSPRAAQGLFVPLASQRLSPAR